MRAENTYIAELGDGLSPGERRAGAEVQARRLSLVCVTVHAAVAAFCGELRHLSLKDKT